MKPAEQMDVPAEFLAIDPRRECWRWSDEDHQWLFDGAACTLQPGMPCLTLWPEWAHAVAHLGKRIENRGQKPWSTILGKRIGIHAGAYIGGRKGCPATYEGINAMGDTANRAGLRIGWSVPERAVSDPVPNALLRPVVCGAIICTAVVARGERNKHHTGWAPPFNPPPWGSPDSPWWWHLADVEVLAEPVPCKGKQGLWRWQPEVQR
jgi:hypothetical protein